MKIPFCFASCLLLLGVGATNAQQPGGLLPPITSESRQRPAVIPFDNKDVEVMRPKTFDENEWRVLHSIPSISTERLVQLLLVYERLENSTMTEALISAILARDPKNAEALRVRDGDLAAESIRAPGYLDQLAAKVLAGQKVDDVDGIATQSLALALSKRAPEAVTLLETLRKQQFATGSFLLLDDLAFAYGEAGRLAEAEAAYRAVIADKAMPIEAVTEAKRDLPVIQLKRRIADTKRAAGTDVNRLLRESLTLYMEQPNSADAIGFRLDAMQAARQFDQALAMLEDLRKRTGTVTPWPWLPELGFTYFAARQWDKAIATFREVQTTPTYDQVTRDEAATMILEVQVSREIETGTFAMQRGDLPRGGETLARLEQNYGTHRDVLGYRAIYLAKTGKGSEALRQLRAKKEADLANHLAFGQQDSLADVHLELKQFKEAREAALLIVNEPRYDLETRLAAIRKLDDIEVAEYTHHAYLALQDGKRQEAGRLVNEMHREYPQRVETKMMQAEVALSHYNAAWARDELLAIQSLPYPNGFAGMPFPGQSALGLSLAQLGYWEAGFNEFSKIMEQPGYEPPDLFDARWSRRALRPWFMPTLEGRITSTHANEGDLLATNFLYRGEWHDDWRFGAFSRTATSSLASGSLFKNTGRTVFDAGILATHRFKDNYYAEAMLGGSNSDPIYGLRFGQYGFRKLGWSVGFEGNTMSTDSTTLQAQNGRENRVDLRISGPIHPRWNVDFVAWQQWNRIGSESIGQGWGASGELSYTLQTETPSRWAITLGYALDMARFTTPSQVPPKLRADVRRAEQVSAEIRKALDPTTNVRRAQASNFGSEVFNSLVDPETQRHGLVLRVRKHYNKWAFGAHLGGYYAFDDKAPGWTIGTTAEYWLTDDSMIYIELRQDSLGKGASTGQQVQEATLGAQISF